MLTPHLRRRLFHARPQLDFKAIVQNAEGHKINCMNRRTGDTVDAVCRLYGEFRALSAQCQQLETERNRISSAGPIHEENRELAWQLKRKIQALNEDLSIVEMSLLEAGLGVPNVTHPMSPIGSEKANVEVERFGPAIHNTAFHLRDHLELGKALEILDFEAGAKVAGSQSYYLKNQGALLEIALVQYAIKVCLARGFKLVLPPDMAYSWYVRACGFSPRVAGGALPIYTVHPAEERDNTCDSTVALVGTAEIPLAGLYAGRILREEDLPIKMVGYGHCFRPEVGHHGAESRGLFRVHQFSKVEMFCVTREGDSQGAFDEIVEIQKEILGALGLPCRVLNMATEELGASAHCKYDMEAWFPAGQRWGELTSASNCTDYQSRRLAIKYRGAEARNRFAHTLNGTACAVPRVIQAILETHQRADGTVAIPPVLHPHMLDGSTTIRKAL